MNGLENGDNTSTECRVHTVHYRGAIANSLEQGIHNGSDTISEIIELERGFPRKSVPPTRVGAATHTNVAREGDVAVVRNKPRPLLSAL